MTLPKQSVPVTRTTTGLINKNEQPFQTLNFQLASKNQRLNIVLSLLHGANYNAPARFLLPVHSPGCHLLAENSMALCLESLSLL